MPITVNGPNGIVVNFPDGTDADTIHGAMSQATGQPVPQAQSQTWAGFTDIPKEIGSSYQSLYDYGKAAAGRIGDQLNPFSEARHKAYAEQAAAPTFMQGMGQGISQVADTGKALSDIPGVGIAALSAATPATALYGTGKSVIGHGMADLEHLAGTYINPQLAAKDNPQEMYDTAKQNFDTSLAGMAPRSASPIGFRPTTTTAPAPTLAQIEAHGKAELNHPDVSGLQIKPEAFSDIKKIVVQDLNSGDMANGIRPTAPTGAPLVYKTLKDLDTPSAMGRPATYTDLQRTKALLGPIGAEVDAIGHPTAQAWAAQRARHLIDEKFAGLPQSSVLAGDISSALPHIKTGNKDFVQLHKASQLATILDNAEISANTANSGMNVGNTIMQKMKPLLLNNGAKAYNYTPQEFAALENVLGRSNNAQTFRRWGNRIAGIPGQVIGGTLGLGVGTAVGHPYIGAATGSWAARSLGDKLKLAAGVGRERSAQQLSELLRRNSPAAAAIASAPPKLNAIQRIAAILAANQGGASQMLGGGVMPAAANQNQQWLWNKVKD
jgi:hypothetical protein